MFDYGQVAVGTSATKIIDADAEHVTEVFLNFTLYLESVSFGDDAVTSSTGLTYTATAGAILNVNPHPIKLHPGQSLYAICSSSSGVTITYLATA